MREPEASANGDSPAEPTTEGVKKGRGNRWHGCHKLNEECGELVQLFGKLGAFPAGAHPDGKGELSTRLEEELGDVLAAISYFIGANPVISMLRVNERMQDKHAKFCEWGLDGLHVQDRYRYIGDDQNLIGHKALARHEGRRMYVQVNKMSHPWAHGWHEVDPRDWEME